MDEFRLIGRNNNRIEMFGDKKVIKKKLVGDAADVMRRQNNLELWQKDLPKNFNTPLLIKQDNAQAVYFYEWIRKTRTVQELVHDTLGTGNISALNDIFIELAKLLATVHKISPSNTDKINNVKLLSRPLIALTPEEYANASGAELECLSLLQHDNDLLSKLKNYTTQEQYKVMIHGDVRLDQFLFNQSNEVWIIDFEEYSFGDLLKDLSGVVGSVLFEVYLKIFSESWEISDEEIDERIINDYLLSREQKLLEEAFPLIKLFLQNYQSKSGKTIDFNYLSINLGSFLLERILSRSKLSFRLSAIDKAILGIGREFIVSSHKLSQIL